MQVRERISRLEARFRQALGIINQNAYPKMKQNGTVVIEDNIYLVRFYENTVTPLPNNVEATGAYLLGNVITGKWYCMTNTNLVAWYPW